MDAKKVAAELLAVRTRILECLEDEHADRQLALERAEESLARLHTKIAGGR